MVHWKVFLTTMNQISRAGGPIWSWITSRVSRFRPRGMKKNSHVTQYSLSFYDDEERKKVEIECPEVRTTITLTVRRYFYCTPKPNKESSYYLYHFGAQQNFEKKKLFLHHFDRGGYWICFEWVILLFFFTTFFPYKKLERIGCILWPLYIYIEIPS